MSVLTIVSMLSWAVLAALAITLLGNRKKRLFGLGILFAMTYQHVFTVIVGQSWYKVMHAEHYTYILAWVILILSGLGVVILTRKG
jgi:hypothetical protein